MSVRRFTNEMGNEIRISAEPLGKLVHVEIEGPSSRSTNIITNLEATHLRGVLSDIIDAIERGEYQRSE